MIPLLRETASQTAGPYVHIGLAPKAAGFDIFENDFGPVLTTAIGAGEASLPGKLMVSGSCCPSM